MSCPEGACHLSDPLILHNLEESIERLTRGYVGGEAFDERDEPVLWHCGDEFVEHPALSEEGMGADFRGV